MLSASAILARGMEWGKKRQPVRIFLSLFKTDREHANLEAAAEVGTTVPLCILRTRKLCEAELEKLGAGAAGQQVKLPPGMLTGQNRVPGSNPGSSKLSIQPSGNAWQVQEFGSLSPTWETQVEVLAPGSDLVQSQLLWAFGE